jgi:hypothetical protein
VTSRSIIRYLVKYLCKTEPVFAAKLDDGKEKKEKKQLDPRTQKFLETPAGKHIYGRLVGAPEVLLRLMSYSHGKGSRQVIHLHVQPDGLRRLSTWTPSSMASGLVVCAMPGRFVSSTMTATTFSTLAHSSSTCTDRTVLNSAS